MSIQVIDDVEKVKILVDETRKKIICMLGRNPMSISELARKLDKTPATIFYHIKKLESVGLIKLEKTRIVNNNLIEKYYSLAIPSSCLISFRMFGPERAPVPPKKLSEIESRENRLCLNICWDDVFATLELELENIEKQSLITTMNGVFERAMFEAGEGFKEAIQQLNIKLSRQDQRKLQRLVSAIPILTFCKMLEKPENLNSLKALLRILSFQTRS
jgi:DNA-binding transcriptional ArsR family regulator